MGEISLTLNSPITKEDWNIINDTEFEDTDEVTFHTKHGRYVKFTKIIRCKDCKWWKRQTAYNGAPLSFGFCECDDMWRSLYGETTEVAHIDTDDDFYCGYAEQTCLYK